MSLYELSYFRLQPLPPQVQHCVSGANTKGSTLLVSICRSYLGGFTPDFQVPNTGVAMDRRALFIKLGTCAMRVRANELKWEGREKNPLKKAPKFACA